MKDLKPLIAILAGLGIAGCPVAPAFPGTDAGTDAPTVPVDGGRDAPAPVVDVGPVDTGPDDGGPPPVDAGPDDTGPRDAGPPDVGPIDGGPALPPITDPSAHTVPASAAGHDRFFGVVFAPDSSFYVVGTAADGTLGTDDHRTIVGHFTAAGDLDTAFGTGGWFQQNLAVGLGGEVARGIGLQSDGRIVVAATVEHVAAGADPRDRDIAVARVSTDGTLDTTFGTAGIALLDLTDGEAVPAPGTGYAADGAWNLEVDAMDRIVIAVQVKRAGETDTDHGIVRLTSGGALDTTFSSDGVYSFDIANVNASVRDVRILPDGRIAGAGYYTEAGIVRPVLYELDASGAPVTTFGTAGVYTEVVLSRQVEAYGAVLQNGTHFVTAGYGGDVATTNDFISLRIDANTGVRDLTYGGGDGVALLTGFDLGDAARNAVVMPDGGVMLLGRIASALTPRVCVGGAMAGTTCTMDTECPGGGCPSSRFEAALWLMTPNGASDTAFSTDGVELHDLGGGATTNNGDPDHFWWGAVDPRGERVVVVGVGGSNPVTDDDGVVYLFPVP